jgi:hypothetical protein
MPSQGHHIYLYQSTSSSSNMSILQVPTLPPQFLSKHSGRAIRMPRSFVDCFPGSAIPLAHTPKKHPRPHPQPDEHPPPNQAMMVRLSSISRLLIHSRRNRISWDIIESTQRGPRYFPPTAQILSVSQMRQRWKGIFNLALDTLMPNSACTLMTHSSRHKRA